MNELDAFRSEVNVNLAYGALADYDLPVTADDGGFPVVVALEHERLSTLLGRLRAVGGNADLFVRGEASGRVRVRLVSVVSTSCAIGDPDDVMVGPDAPGPDATVGMFVDYLELRPNGVAISAVVGHWSYARDPQTVEFAGAM